MATDQLQSNPATPVTLDVEVTPSDYEDFNLHVAFRPRLRARWRRQFLAMYGIAFAVVVAANLVVAGTEGFDWRAHLLAPAVLVLAFAAVATPASYALHRWNVKRTVRAMLGGAPREDFLGRKRIEASDSGISVTGRASRGDYGWAAVTGVEETGSLLLVMLGEALAIIVPKRGQDEATLAALRACVIRGTAAAGAGRA